MTAFDKHAAIAAYKERKTAAGIYALRCHDRLWLGKAPDLGTIRNRLWFTLRQGSNPHRSLQQAWAQHGEEAFTFEIVETVPEEELQFGRDRALKRRLDHWVAAWGATAI